MFMIHFEFIHKNVLFVQNVKKGILYTCIFWGAVWYFYKEFPLPIRYPGGHVAGPTLQSKSVLASSTRPSQFPDPKITFFAGKAYLYVASHRYIVTLLWEDECIKRKLMVYIHMLRVLCMSISINQFRDTSLKFYFSDWQTKRLDKAGISDEYR